MAHVITIFDAYERFPHSQNGFVKKALLVEAVIYLVNEFVSD